MIVSAIVPCFNEEKTVRKVVTTLLANPKIDEVIVVNDGSTDESLTELNKFEQQIKLINLKQNRGKGWALTEGIKQAQGELVMFIDADLVNLNQKKILALLKPILDHHYRGVIGIRKKSRLLPAPLAKLSGERVYYKKDLLPILDQMKRARFGVEILLNHSFNNKSVKKISLLKLHGLGKYEKRTPALAVKEYLEEGVEIAKELARQEKLKAEDLKIIERLKNVASFKELKEIVAKISNLKIREYLQKYVLNYLGKARTWWQKW
ncbi:MAG: glycosyltransferase family 2 protein [Patescibacteria group bacterium]|nr:glycosyltransferase family 2 protein [Patescibacteria group bacterium]